MFFLAYFCKDGVSSYELREYHVLSCLPALISLYYNKYGIYVVIGMFYGEITNPIQQSCLLLKYNKKCQNLVKQALYYNNIFFIVNRLVVSPYINYLLLRNIDDHVYFYFLSMFAFLYIISFCWSVQLYFNQL